MRLAREDRFIQDRVDAPVAVDNLGRAIGLCPPGLCRSGTDAKSTYVSDAPFARRHAGETSVKDQVHIRNAEAAQLERKLARKPAGRSARSCSTRFGNTGRNLSRATAIVSIFGAGSCVAIARA